MTQTNESPENPAWFRTEFEELSVEKSSSYEILTGNLLHQALRQLLACLYLRSDH